jgi:hypothetical protein
MTEVVAAKPLEVKRLEYEIDRAWDKVDKTLQGQGGSIVEANEQVSQLRGMLNSLQSQQAGSNIEAVSDK